MVHFKVAYFPKLLFSATVLEEQKSCKMHLYKSLDVEGAVWKREAGIFLSVTGHGNNVSRVCEMAHPHETLPLLYIPNLSELYLSRVQLQHRLKCLTMFWENV